jgi:pre-60S factor REI1
MNSVLSLLNQHSASQSEKEDSESHSESCDHANPPEAEGDEDSKLPVKTSLDSLRICLFCNKELSGVKKCLDHMRLKHSFYVLDVDCVTSLKGLLTYIAERIQLGYLCLFCSKMFRNSRRCQQHMMDKAHCFMNVDDEHEYEQYYDFSKTYEGHPDAEAQRPLITKKVTSSKPDGEDEAKEGEWEDVDVEDDGEEDVVIIESDEEEEENKDQAKSESGGAFSIITDSKEENTLSGKFQNITSDS